MIAKAKVVSLVCHQRLPVSDVPLFGKGSNIEEIDETLAIRSPNYGPVRLAESVTSDLPISQLDVKSLEKVSDPCNESSVMQFFPSIRSGSFADIGPRRYMEDENIRIDNLSSHFGSVLKFPKPSAFYGTREVDDVFLEGVEHSLWESFLFADLVLADDCTVNSSSRTTALTALIFGRLLMVANAGDCRAVLCRNGEAIDTSEDHKPIYQSERRRVEELGGFIDDGYLNGVLSVSRALGDWDMLFPKGSSSPLIAEPLFRQMVLTEDEEFLIIGCDGIWDVMSSQHAVSLVRRGLRRHDDPEQCAKDLVMEALRSNTFDNLTVIIICFAAPENREQPSPRQRRLKCCSLSAEALCSLRSLLNGNAK